jgi:catechol 2,3-dioxygenase-like lactoylglutathione lyase family enzyme
MTLLSNVLVLVAAQAAAIGAGGGAVRPRPPTQPRLEHVAVWAADIDRTARFLEEALGWRRHPLEFGVREDSAVFGGMKLAFVDGNGFWIELVQPTTEGPGMEFLRQKGNGSIVELDFFVDDFDQSVELLRTKGITAMGMDGEPMKDGGLLKEWALIDGKVRDADERLAYLPMEVSRGTSIELGWEYPSGVVIYRDETWGPREQTPQSAPRMDHVTVAAADLEKTAEVYTKVLELQRAAGVPGLRRDWMGVTEGAQTWIHGNAGVWINLVAPAGDAGQRLLADPRYGDGNIMELAAEVGDLDAFHDAMKAKGIVMTSDGTTPLAAGTTAVTTPTGDRYSYFPTDRSEGMRIVVFERARGASGALAQRNAATLR